MALLAFIILYVPVYRVRFKLAWSRPSRADTQGFHPKNYPVRMSLFLLGGATEGESRFGHGADFNNARRPSLHGG